MYILSVYSKVFHFVYVIFHHVRSSIIQYGYIFWTYFHWSFYYYKLQTLKYHLFYFLKVVPCTNFIAILGCNWYIFQKIAIYNDKTQNKWKCHLLRLRVKNVEIWINCPTLSISRSLYPSCFFFHLYATVLLKPYFKVKLSNPV